MVTWVGGATDVDLNNFITAEIQLSKRISSSNTKIPIVAHANLDNFLITPSH